MLERVNDWTMAMHNLHQLSVAYIDFAKTFDNVCHSKLIRKLVSFAFVSVTKVVNPHGRTQLVIL